MADEPSVRDTVIAILRKEYCDHVPVEELTDSQRLEEDLGMDSLDELELLLLIEEALDIDIPDEKWQSITTPTVGGLVKLAESRVAARG